MKRKISVILVLLLVFSLSANAYGSEASISSGISDLNAKITKAQSELAVFESKNSALTSTSELVFGTVISTDPFIVLGMGMGINSFIMPTNYYYIEDPQNGKSSSIGEYAGYHKFMGRKFIDDIQVNIMGPVPESDKNIPAKIAAKKSEIDFLFALRSKLEADLENGKKTYTPVSTTGIYEYFLNSTNLANFAKDAPNEILLQIGNPRMLRYGEYKFIESGNIKAVPVIKDGRTLVPIAAISDALGGISEWNSAKKSVICNLVNKTIEMQIGSKTGYINGDPVNMPVAASIINGKTMVPLSFVAENFGVEKVDWISEQKIIVITYPQNWGARVDSYATDEGNTIRFKDMGSSVEYSYPKSWGKPISVGTDYWKDDYGKAATIFDAGNGIEVSIFSYESQFYKMAMQIEGIEIKLSNGEYTEVPSEKKMSDTWVMYLSGYDDGILHWSRQADVQSFISNSKPYGKDESRYIYAIIDNENGMKVFSTYGRVIEFTVKSSNAGSIEGTIQELKTMMQTLVAEIIAG